MNSLGRIRAREILSACKSIPSARFSIYQSRRSLSAVAKDQMSRSDKGVVEEHDEFEENLLEGKKTRENVHAAFARRAMAAIKYEYFAQRAELEVEIDAANVFRSMAEAAKQQSMGFLELLEDYRDADFGNTVDNLAMAAQTENEAAEDLFPKYAEVAAEEQFDQIDQWFQDMTQASERAAQRLDFVSSVVEPDEFEADAEDDEAVPTGGPK